MKKIMKWFMYLMFLIFFVLVLFTEEKLTLLLSIIPFLFVYKYIDKISDRYFPIFLFLLAFVIRIITIILLDVPIMDDFKTMYEASNSLIMGNLDFTKNAYFMNFSYQLGFVFVQAFFLKILNHLWFLKLVNSVVTSLCVVFIFLIASNISSKRSSKIVSILYTLYFYPIYLNSILTNQHLQALFLLIIIYLITRKNQNRIIDHWLVKSVLIGLLLGFSNIVRSEAIVLLVSFIGISIIYCNRKNWKMILKSFGVTIGIFFMLITSVNLLCQSLHLSENGLKNNVPLWKFYVGLSVSENGMYNEKDQDVFFSKTKEYQQKLLVDRIRNDYLQFPILFLKKEVITFTKSKFNIVIDHDAHPTLLKWVFYFSNGILLLIFLLLLFGIYPRGDTIDQKVVCILMILFFYCGVYLLIEASPRYGYNLQMILFVLGSLGVDQINNHQKMQQSLFNLKKK